ncbi:unnamed protein product [Rotaria socialis]|uniref:Uncharacterized protein n=1 Tax=Rotaria socialis TaxID=392032 RepID=A0A821RDV7_9BILA|nr:unnamed protein product [Rotaria socialis]CAF4841750.1 unnamed protein product [Rotaria socialis]
MSIKRFCTVRTCSLKISILTFVIVLYCGNHFKQHDSVLLKLNCSDSTKIEYESEKSLFKPRLNQRLFRIGQRFSHINIDKLLRIQSSSTQSFTYYCSKHCGGWGDRLRGITSAYILAVFLQRRFILDMQYPYQQKNFLRVDLINNAYGGALASNVSSGNLTKFWLIYDNIYFTTNADFISIVLKNPFFNLIKSEINIRSTESTQQELFPFIFELLFKPSSSVIAKLDPLFLKSSLHFNQSIICLHIRTGKSLALPGDFQIPHRQSIVQDMINFIDKNLSQPYSSIFITSDSDQIQQHIHQHYGDDRVLSVNGPIIHIDRFIQKTPSNETLYHGFLKVIADFYFLGECDTLLRARSGFSEWAGRRRWNEYSNLYVYCRGIYRMKNQQWRRPHHQC